MSSRIKVSAMLLAGSAIAPVQLAALSTGAAPEAPLAQSAVGPFGAISEPVVLLLLGLILATVGVLARRSPEKRGALKSPHSRDV